MSVEQKETPFAASCCMQLYLRSLLFTMRTQKFPSLLTLIFPGIHLCEEWTFSGLTIFGRMRPSTYASSDLSTQHHQKTSNPEINAVDFFPEDRKRSGSMFALSCRWGRWKIAYAKVSAHRPLLSLQPLFTMRPHKFPSLSTQTLRVDRCTNHRWQKKPFSPHWETQTTELLVSLVWSFGRKICVNAHLAYCHRWAVRLLFLFYTLNLLSITLHLNNPNLNTLLLATRINGKFKTIPSFLCCHLLEIFLRIITLYQSRANCTFRTR